MDICLANTWDLGLGAGTINLIDKPKLSCCWFFSAMASIALIASSPALVICNITFHFQFSFLPPNYVNFDKWYHRQTDDESTLSWVFFVEQLKRSLGSCLGKLFFHWHPKKVKSLPKLRGKLTQRRRIIIRHPFNKLEFFTFVLWGDTCANNKFHLSYLYNMTFDWPQHLLCKLFAQRTEGELGRDSLSELKWYFHGELVIICNLLSIGNTSRRLKFDVQSDFSLFVFFFFFWHITWHAEFQGTTTQRTPPSLNELSQQCVKFIFSVIYR